MDAEKKRQPAYGKIEVAKRLPAMSCSTVHAAVENLMLEFFFRTPCVNAMGCAKDSAGLHAGAVPGR